MLFLGSVVSPPAGAQGSPDESIEFLDTIEIADTLADEEEREISIPKPDTTMLVPFNEIMFATIPQNPPNPIASQDGRLQLMRDSIADRKGLWQSVRLMSARAERRISLAALDTSTVVPFKGLLAPTISKASIVQRDGPQLVRDSIADRKGLWQSVRIMPQAERRISLAALDTSTVAPFKSLLVATISKASIVQQDGPQLVRDSIADRKGLWQSVRIMPQAERRISLAALDTSTVVPFGGLLVSTISQTPIAAQVTQDGAKLVRDSIADRKGLRTRARMIKSEQPPYPKMARERGWEGTVMLRLTINTRGMVEKVKTQKSSGHTELDESAMQSVKGWRFDPAKDGEFPVSTVVDLPIRFNLDEYKQ